MISYPAPTKTPVRTPCSYLFTPLQHSAPQCPVFLPFQAFSLHFSLYLHLLAQTPRIILYSICYIRACAAKKQILPLPSQGNCPHWCHNTHFQSFPAETTAERAKIPLQLGRAQCSIAARMAIFGVFFYIKSCKCATCRIY